MKAYIPPLWGVLAVIATPAITAEPAPVTEVISEKITSSSSTIEQYRKLEQQLDARNRAQVKVQRQLDDLQNEVNELRGITELHTHQLSQILDRQRELYQELDRRVTEALKVTATGNSPSSMTQTSHINNVNYSDDITENEAYERAVNMVLREKRYEQAIPEFEAFNERYPYSSYSANAHYWLGQLLFNKGDLVKAGVEFDLLVNKFHQSNKRSDAMLKLAIIEQKKPNTVKAIALYQKLITEYPNSGAAKLAKVRLKSLKP